MKKTFTLCFPLSLIAFVSNLLAQTVTQSTIAISPPVVVNFTDKANYETRHPLPLQQRFIEQVEDLDEDFEFALRLVISPAATFNVPPVLQNRSGTNSPATSVSFNGTMDNSSLIPPDIRGAVGPNHVMETTNQEYKIYSKTGALVSTVSIPTFFAATGGSRYFDPHILYDSTNNRWVICSAGKHSSGNSGLFISVSQTNNPAGSWYVYSFDGIGNSYDFLDYPLMGYNTNWLVITGNDFLNSGSVTGKIYVMNRASLYSGTLGTVNVFNDANVFSMAPAQTYDAAQSTLYMVQNWNGNSGGNGYVRIGTITGTPNAPSYSTGNLLGVSQPWSNSRIGAVQLGSSFTLEAGDSRMGNAVYRNGFLWFCQNVFLPASAPTRIAVQWWQVNPVAPSVQQFGRVDGGSSTGMFYFYPSIAVNASNDVLLGHCQSSTTSYASASYSVRSSSDAVNTLQTPYVFKNGVAGYYKTFGAGRNRWGDYTGACVDPSDNSFWNFSEWANTGNYWATAIANISVPSASCHTPSGLSTTPVGNTYATFNWGAVAGATSYRVQYRASGTSTWTTVTTINIYYTATGLTQGTGYEWQVQAICTSGTSAYTSIQNFTTTGTSPCNTPSSMATSGVTTTSATFSWGAVSGAVSYNIRYRQVGAATWINTTSTTNSKTVSGLTASTNYEWQVQTVCSSATSAFTLSATFITPTVTSCGVPSGLSVCGITSSSATLSWNAVSGATSYYIRYRTVGSSTWSTTSAATTSRTISGLSGATSYEWNVLAICSGTSSAYSTTNTFTTLASGTCGMPTVLYTNNITSTSATMNWSAVSGSSYYNVSYHKLGSSTWPGAAMNANYFIATGLTSGTTYEWKVKAVCPSGSSAYTGLVQFTTLGSATCQTPLGLITNTIGSSTATLSWSAATGALSYKILYRVVGLSAWSSTTSATNSCTLNGLSPVSNYEICVRSACSAGDTSTYSPIITFTTSGSSACDVPHGTSWADGSSIITVTIGAVPGAVSYNMRYREYYGNGVWTYASTSTTSVSTGTLVNGGFYEIQLQSVCAFGVSQYSSSTLMTHNGLCGCCRPNSLVNTPTTTIAFLSWSSNSGATGYNLNYRAVGASTWNTGGTTDTTYSLTGLVPGTAYEWQVARVCSIYTSAYTIAKTFVTLPVMTCTEPRSLTVGTVASTTANLSWTGDGSASNNVRYRQARSSNIWSNAIASGTSCTITGLSPGWEYDWQVQTVCSLGVTHYVSGPRFTVGGTAGCSAPAVKLTTAITITTANFNWSPVSGATDYYVKYRIIGTDDWEGLLHTTDTTIYVWSLTPATAYEWTVQAVCGSGISACSLFNCFTTASGTTCSAPLNAKVLSATHNTATVTWLPVSGATSYNIQYHVVGSTTWTQGSATGTTYNITGLTPYTDYEWTVNAVCSNGYPAPLVVPLLLTTAPLLACADYFETNNTYATGPAVTPNSSFSGFITPSTDVDWFKVSTTLANTNVEINLTDLPADYDMDLYASNGSTLLGTSQTRGTVNEQIKYPSSLAGTYYLKVYGYNGANNASVCYRVGVCQSPIAFLTMPQSNDNRNVTGINDSIAIEPAMKIYPNPAGNEVMVEYVRSTSGDINMNVYNLEGQKVLGTNAFANEGINTQLLKTTGLSNGVYLFELEDHGETQRMRFVISK